MAATGENVEAGRVMPWMETLHGTQWCGDERDDGIDDPHRERVSLWRVPGVLGVLTIVVGVAGYRTSGDSWLQSLYETVRLFTIEGTDASSGYLIEIARWLALGSVVSLGAVGVWQVFEARLRLAFLGLFPRHAVVCGAGPEARRLVEQCRASGRPVVVIERDAQHAGLSALEELGASIVVGDATLPEVLRRARAHKARDVIAVTANDGRNAAVAVAVSRLRADSSGLRDATCAAHIENPELRQLLRRQLGRQSKKDPLELRLFNRYEHAARLLFIDHLVRDAYPSHGADAPVHLVVVGMGHMGEAVALQAARMPHATSLGRLRITVLARNAARRGSGFLRRYPSARSENGVADICDLSFRDVEIADAHGFADVVATIDREQRVDAIVICLEDEALGSACALAVLSARVAEHATLAVRASSERGLVDLLTSDPPSDRRVFAFGRPMTSCSLAVVLDDKLDEMARTLHERYREARRAEARRKGAAPPTDAAMNDWADLPEDLRRSNRQAADHLPFKLHAVGCWVRALRPGEPAETVLTPEEHEHLAKMEHTRWVVGRLLDGWRLSPDGKKNVAERLSPHLVPWADLDEPIREYDRESVAGLPFILESAKLRMRRVGGDRAGS